MTSNTIDLCEGLKNIGHSVTLIVGKPKEDYQFARAAYLDAIGVKMLFVPDVRGTLLTRLKAFLQLLKVLSTEKLDILHFESIYLTFLPKLLGKKFVLTYHSFGLNKNIFSKHATRLISISEGITKDAIARHGYDLADIDVVLHGVSERFAAPYTRLEQNKFRGELSLPDHKIIIGIVASIEPRKGHLFLLEAVALLPTELQENLHVVFCGNFKGSDSEKWINDSISRYSLTEKVTLLGFQDPLKVYRCLDIFCLPSVWEGFPLTVVEAMMASCCVIRSNVQGAKEQIKEGITGFTFASENPRALAAVLTHVLSNPNLIKETSEKARLYALDNFSLKRMAMNTVDVYKKVLLSDRK